MSDYDDLTADLPDVEIEHTFTDSDGRQHTCNCPTNADHRE